MLQLLKAFLDVKDQIAMDGKVKNLATLRIPESIHNFIIETIFLPKLTATLEKETTTITVISDAEGPPKQAPSRVATVSLRAHQLELMSLTTSTWRWKSC